MEPPVSDPLKALDQVLQPDPREKHYRSERLPLIHAELSRLALHDGVPGGVRQLFETAKNVALYTYFVYRFHQVAEMVAHAALEMALKHRAEVEKHKVGLGLTMLLKHAIKNGWITEKGFSSRDRMARERLRTRRGIELARANPTAEIIDISEPSPEEVAAETRPFDFELALLGVAQEGVKQGWGLVDQRNELAHGSRQLHPHSRTTLRLVAETINQLFPLP